MIIIALWVKPIISRAVSKEQFRFLLGRQLHEVIGIPQEGLHSVVIHQLKGVVIKMDLSKAYDRVSWVYLKLILTQTRFPPFFNWIMGCIQFVSFVVLINDSASQLFHEH